MNRQWCGVLVLSLSLIRLAASQQVTASVSLPDGYCTANMAINPVTNKIYVASNSCASGVPGSNAAITVIDGATNASSTIYLDGSLSYSGLAINAATNKVYAANYNGSVIVFDGATNATTAVATSASPDAIAINPVTNKIYVADRVDGTVTIIDGFTNETATITNAGRFTNAIAVNPVTNKIYLANAGFCNLTTICTTGSLTVIDGYTNALSVINTGTFSKSLQFDDVVVNPVTNKIYVVTFPGPLVIDGATNAVSELNGVGITLALNPVTDKIYVANEGNCFIGCYGPGSVTVVDGATNAAVTITAGIATFAVAVNAVNNRIYATNIQSNSVTAIDGSNNTATSLNVGNDPMNLAINPITNKAYVLCGDSVTVIDGATNLPSTTNTGLSPLAVVSNPLTNQTYVANHDSNNVTLIDGATNSTKTISVGTNPDAIDLDPVTNKVYVANFGSGSVTVIDGATTATTSLSVGNNPVAVVVNPLTNKVYVADKGTNDVTVIDGTNNATTAIAVGAGPVALAINLVTNRIYVADAGDNTVTVIDANTNAVSTINISSSPIAIVVNPATNTVFVVGYQSSMTVIDGATGSTTTVSVGPDPRSVSIDSVTNKIYVANYNAGNTGTVTVVDGATNTTATIPAGMGPLALAVNPASNKIYVANNPALSANPSTVTVIDGATNTTSAVNVDVAPSALAVNAATGTVYVTNQASADVTMIREQQMQPIPLTTAVTALSGNQFLNLGGAQFRFLTNSAYSPIEPSVQNVYFQVDTWQGPWLNAKGQAPQFMGTASPLMPGVHTLYAFAADGMFGDSIQQASPTIGAIAAFVFASQQTSSTFLTLTGGSNIADYGQLLTFNVNVLPQYGGVPTGSITLLGDNMPLGSQTLSAGSASITVLTPAVGVHNITTAYGGDSNFGASTSPPLTQVVVTSAALNGSGALSTQTALAAPSHTFFRQIAALSVNVTSSSGTVNGGFVLLDGDRLLAPELTLNANGMSSYSVQLPYGLHNLRAAYLGNSSFNGSVSPIQAVLASPRPNPR